jgi:nicotinate-nucleotide pyrophosphorylase (carboxylating)
MKYPRQIVLPEAYIRRRFEEFILEDAPQGDLTTDGIFDLDIPVSAKILPQEDLVFAGEQLIANCFDPSVEIRMYCADGQSVKENQSIAEINGNAGMILLRERVLLNLLQRLCGIATQTRKFVEIATPHQVKILDTRKTTPGLRRFEKYAVAVAGGYNHRLDLSSGILIKDNHIKAAGSITKAVDKIRSRDYDLPIEVEVETTDEIEEALKCQVEGLLLDNMSPAETRHAVDFIRVIARTDVFIEASGGITLETIGEYVKTGVDAVSVGSLTHGIRSSNIHMEFDDA